MGARMQIGTHCASGRKQAAQRFNSKRGLSYFRKRPALERGIDCPGWLAGKRIVCDPLPFIHGIRIAARRAPSPGTGTGTLGVLRFQRGGLYFRKSTLFTSDFVSR